MKVLISSTLLEIGVGFKAAEALISIAAIHRIWGGSPALDRCRGKMVEGKGADYLIGTDIASPLQSMRFQLSASA